MSKEAEAYFGSSRTKPSQNLPDKASLIVKTYDAQLTIAKKNIMAL